MPYNIQVQIPDVIVKDIEKKIIAELDKMGIFYRIFSRVKSSESTLKKLNEKNYTNDRKMQDLLGIRIVLYFNDDIDICEKTVSNIFEKVDEVIDRPNSSTFKPTRTNIVYRLDKTTTENIEYAIYDKYIDNTFELQLRTVFSEGWHEVEHDLRYKCSNEWDSYDDQHRTLNGLVATLETCDWAIMKLFSDLAYLNYKDDNIVPMLRNKFRIRFINTPLDSSLESMLKKDSFLTKEIFRVDREALLKKLSETMISIPLTFNNIVYISNYYFIRNKELNDLMPKTLKDYLFTLDK
ncbi:hypothetical protein P4H83_21325 [Paenibacillus favisporus]|uniref:hypothetical protein n=1 Tax=Paenibacillus favisporus TaxID=221028 RepID=UPI002DB9912D|nr:hypothetical protein [Paenibacillus favisporus]MEC0177423.1 hypothetical protein [Paenibacillus favisporus]